MKKNKIQQFAVVLTGMALSFAACTTDVYEPKTGLTPNEEGISQELKDFGFATRKNVSLNVNYDAPGFKTLIEVYAENPMQEDGKTKKTEVKPIYAAYTDDNGKLETSMYVPSAVKEAYLYTNSWGLPLCVKLESVANGMTYDATTARRTETKTATKVPYDYVIGNKQPYSLSGRTDNVMALGRFDTGGFLFFEGFGSPSDYTPSYISTTTSIKNEPIADLSARAQAYFTSYDGKREELLKPADVTNIKIAKAGSLDLVYLTEMGSYLNTFGYYYYEAGKAPKTEADFKAMKKYIVFPQVDTYALKPGYTVRLKYFGADGTAEASEQFPVNTVIGWFLISDGWNNHTGLIREWNQYERNFFFSNDEDKNMRFVAVKDVKTGTVVLGCEDQVESKFDRNNEDYTDVLFFVKSDDGELDNEDKPEITDPDKPVSPDASISIEGVLAFEDIWPKGGDYDMNDVALKYSRNISFNKSNKAILVEENFEFIHREGAATLDNYFSYQVENMGQVVEKPSECIVEEETGSLILNVSAKSTFGKKYTIKRTLDGSLDISNVALDFNPYIIVGEISDKRKEVHLPMKKPTDKADLSLNGSENDAYYMKKDGSYPFAIDIAKMDFELSAEGNPIDKTYPRFATWAASNGKEADDWYQDAPQK